jgi:uncharacterized membrane protein
MYKGVLIFIIFIVIDLIYINFSKSFYEYHMNIQYSNVKVIPAILAWICIAISYYYSVQEPFENKYLRGLILAIGMYGVYNFTNYSIYPNYSLNVTIRDSIWGTSLITLITVVTWLAFDSRL